MSTDRGENDREGDQKQRGMLEESDSKSVGEERRERVHSDRGSSIPRNHDVQNSGNSAEDMREVLSPLDEGKKEKHRERSKEDHQGSSHYSGGSSLLAKRSDRERSPQYAPEKKRKLTESIESTTEERDKQHERSEEYRKESLHGSRKPSHSEKSPQYSPERMRKTSVETTEVKDDGIRKREKQRERSNEHRYYGNESPHSLSSSRKRSHSPSSSSERERKASDAPRFKIPKKEHKADDLRDKLDKKPDRREAERSERSSSETSKSSSRRERPITSPALKQEIKDLLRTEHHHLMNKGKKDANGDFQDVEWCYKYLDPTIRGHITGGRAILHHRCRQCNRICLHLLGKYNTGKRMCLICAGRERGWREKEVPSWYFHDEKECSNCRKTRYDRPNYGSYYYSR